LLPESHHQSGPPAHSPQHPTGCASWMRRRVAVSFRPVISTVGRPRPDSSSALHRSIPFSSGRFTSISAQALAFGIALASSALGRSKARTLKPAVWINLESARATTDRGPPPASKKSQAFSATRILASVRPSDGRKNNRRRYPSRPSIRWRFAAYSNQCVRGRERESGTARIREYCQGRLRHVP
jgi:hypothetical protein